MRVLLAAAAAGLWTSAAAAQPAMVVLPWGEGVVHSVVTTPGRVTDIALEPGEELAASGAVAAGDTARWIIGESESGAGATRRRHVLVKPTAPGLATNLVIATNRRSYHLELRSTAAAYAASVSWRYPAGQLIALQGPSAGPAVNTPALKPAEPALAIENLNFAWRIDGEAPWKPERVYDDGRRVVIEFPAVAQEMPPLFERSPKDGAAQLLSYRVVGRKVVVDRVFSDGELRLGEGRRQVRVRLRRDGAS